VLAAAGVEHACEVVTAHGLIVDVLLGGRRGTAALRIEGRPYTTIERVLVQRMVEVVLADARAVGVSGAITISTTTDDAQRALLTLAAGATAGWRIDERPLPAPAAAGSAP